MNFAETTDGLEDAPQTAAGRSAAAAPGTWDSVGVNLAPSAVRMHDLRTRKMGEMIVVDAHAEVDASIGVEAGHDIAVLARRRVLERHRVINLMTHVDPWHRPDLDQAASGSAASP